ncbi:hypothetical protein [Streptomyces sp. NPDC001970]
MPEAVERAAALLGGHPRTLVLDLHLRSGGGESPGRRGSGSI